MTRPRSMPSLLVVRGWSSCVWSTPYLPLNPGDRGDPPAISAVGGIYGPLAVASGETVRRFYPPGRHMAAFHAYWLTPFTNSTPPNHHVKRRRQKKATRSTRDHETGTKKGRRPRGRRPAQRKGCLLISLRHGLGHVAVGALHIFHSVRRGVGFTAATRAACGGRWGKPELPPVRR